MEGWKVRSSTFGWVSGRESKAGSPPLFWIEEEDSDTESGHVRLNANSYFAT